MKKLLLLVTCLFIGASAALAELTINSDQAYKVKLRGQDVYLNLDMAVSGESGNNASLQSQGSIVYILQKEGSNNEFAVKSHETEKYLSANSWNSIRNSDSAFYWTFAEVADTDSEYQVVTLNQQTSTFKGFLGFDNSAAGSLLFCNKSATNWELIPVYPITLSYTYDGKVYTLPLATVASGETYTTPTFDESVITLSGVPEGPVTAPVTITGTLKDGVQLFKLVSAAASNLWANAGETNFLLGTEANAEWLVYVPDGDNFKIYSLTNRKYVTPYGGGADNVTFTDNYADAATFKLWKKNDGSEGISLSTAANTGTSTFLNKRGDHIGAWSFDEGSSWFMVFNEEAYNSNIGKFVQNGGELKTAYENAVSKYTQLAAITNLPEEYVSMRDALKTAIDNADAARFGVEGVSIADVIAALNTATAAAANINEHFISCTLYLTNADAFAAMGIATTEGIEIWNTFKASLQDMSIDAYTDETTTAVLEQYTALVGTSANTPGGAHLKLASNREPNDFMCVRLINNAYESGRYSSDVNGNKTTWTLVAAEGGFRLYNEYSGTYAKFPTANNTTFATVSDAEQSSVFIIDIFDASTARYGIKCVSEDADATLCYLHTNQTNGVFRWEKGANSSWYIHSSNAEIAANEANIGANEDVENARTNFVYAGTVGSKVGQYSDANSHDAEYNAALSAFNALNNESTNAAKHSAAGSLRAIYPTMNLSLNMPQAGKFYRLAGDSKYLTSTPSGTDRIAMVDKSNNGATTVVYVTEDGKLISLNNGLALGKFTTNDDRLFVSPDGNDAATVEFSSCPAIGKYYIKTGSNDTKDFYIYNASDVVGRGSYDKGSTAGIDDNTGYRWNIEEVTWLPIPVGENKHVTIYSPVTLKNGDNRFKLHTLEVNGEFAEIIKTPLEDGAYIQPNTVYYGEVSTTEAPTNGCYYLEIAETEQTAVLAADKAEAETPATQIKGSFIATAKQEGSSYYTIGVKDDAAHFLAHTDDTYLPGFTAHVVSTAPSEAVNTLGGYKLVTKDGASTSIREVEAAAQGADVVYDLSGRRVSKAVRGLYIINGKKVMVK